MNDNTSLKSATDAGFGINGPSVVVTPSRTPVVTAIESHDAIGFVNINTTESEYPTASFRYLTAISSSNNSAYVHTDSGPVLCVQSEATKKAMQAEYRALSKQIEYSDSLIACDEISAASEPGDNRVNSDIAIPIYQDSRPIGVQAAAVLDSARTTDAECADTQTVLVPSTIPHDSAIHLEQAGYTLQSTSAVTNARVKKDAAERQAIKIVQSAGLAAIARIETQIADMTVSDGQLLLQYRLVFVHAVQMDIMDLSGGPSSLRVREDGNDERILLLRLRLRQQLRQPNQEYRLQLSIMRLSQSLQPLDLIQVHLRDQPKNLRILIL